MYLTPEIKKDLFKDNGQSDADTGSAEGQIALFTFRIKHLTGHLKENKKDLATQRSLVRLVGKRRKMLDYLKKKIESKDVGKSIGINGMITILFLAHAV